MGKRWYQCSLGGVTLGVGLGRSDSLGRSTSLDRSDEKYEAVEAGGPKPVEGGRGRRKGANELTMQYKVQARGVTVIVLLVVAVILLMGTSLGTGKAVQQLEHSNRQRMRNLDSFRHESEEERVAAKHETPRGFQRRKQHNDIGWAALNGTSLAQELKGVVMPGVDEEEEAESEEDQAASAESEEKGEAVSDPEQVGLFVNAPWSILMAQIANGTVDPDALPDPEPNSPLSKPETWGPVVASYLWPWTRSRLHACPYLNATANCTVPAVASLADSSSSEEQLITLDVLNATSQYMKKKYQAWRGQIVNGTFYLSELWPSPDWVPTVANTKMVILEAIRQFGPGAFPDVDFIMNQWDTPLISITDFPNQRLQGAEYDDSQGQEEEGDSSSSKPDSELPGNATWHFAPETPPETPVYKFFEPPWPVFSPARTLGKDLDIPFPDFSFMYGPNNEFRTPTWDVRRRLVALEAKRVPWEQRASMAIWSGHVGGVIRGGLKRLAEENPEVLFVNDFNIYAKTARKCNVGIPGDHYVGRGIGSATNVCYMEFKDLCKFKYLVHVRGGVGGATYSNRFKDLLLCGSVVLYVEYPWKEFFEPMLRPWEHYVPIHTLADLPAVIRHLQANDQQAKRIGERGAEFMRGMGSRAVSAYVVELFRQYSELQSFAVQPKLGSQAITCPLDLYMRYNLELEDYPGFACMNEEARREAMKKREAQKAELKALQQAEKERKRQEKRKKKKKGKGKGKKKPKPAAEQQ